ncbi:MAG: glycosyltransferase family 61 protein [Methanosarcinales archaeon]|nr:MAG: glycosyltransferase family 61 protein [Methanosarcinales archaeon]
MLREQYAATARPQRKIYISRNQAGKRKIINEVELEAFVGEYGFETVHAETMSLEDQIAVFQTLVGYSARMGPVLPICCFVYNVR